ncbi:MerR family transcriptional regulator [Streptomyces subrutilus]|uniref:MerR family transcriptional regulator n=1 Tax=Streptomyces subrutilus TaxID=36818 RepID=UPI002E0DD20F|nr:MerR family transcriptional regulator [Streptomyces subrutilus]
MPPAKARPAAAAPGAARGPRSARAGATAAPAGAPRRADVGLSTGAVAQRLGVAATTLRSWERRYAIGPAVRIDGKHRRWLAEDIARLEEMCRLTALGVPPAEAARAARTPGGPAGTGPGRPEARAPGGRDALPLGRARAECRGLARAAVRLDAPAVEVLLRGALEEHGCVSAWEEIIAPTLHAVGRKWASAATRAQGAVPAGPAAAVSAASAASAGERYIEVEHLLSWLVSCALRSLPRSAPRTGFPPVLLACAPGELHSLPLEALWAGLGERALPVRMFGPAVPADALGEAVRRVAPSLVVVWAQGRPSAPSDIVTAVEGTERGLRGARTRSTLLVAGPGWSAVPDAGSRRLTGLGSGLDLIERMLPR